MLRYRRARTQERRCCGDFCGWGVHPISSWVQVPDDRCGFASPPLGTGNNSSDWFGSRSSPTPAASHVLGGWPPCGNEFPVSSERCPVTSRCGGVMVGSEDCLRRRDTSTRATTACRVTSPCNDVLRSLRVRGAIARPRTATGTGALAPLLAVRPPPRSPGGNGPLYPRRNVGAFGLQRRRWTRLHRAAARPGGRGTWI